MKYWVFQNNQVTGPFDPEDLSQVAGFSGDTLVCPEGRKGTNMGDWQRASLVPELSVSILKASQLALAVKGGGYPALPPEPTLKDLAALGSLQEKVSVLDNMVAHLQESLRIKDDELLSVHKELQEKARYAQDLSVKLGSVEERLTQINTLREGLDKAVAAEHDVQSTVEKQAQTIDQLRSQLDALREEEKGKVLQLESELARVRKDDEDARAQLSQRLADASAAAAEAAAKAQAAKEEAEKAEAAAKAIPAAAPLPAITPAPAPAPMPMPSAAPVLGAPELSPLTPMPAADAPPPGMTRAATLGLASERPSDSPAPTLTPAPAPAAGLGDPAWMQPAPLSPSPLPAAGEGLKPLGLGAEPPATLDGPLSPAPLSGAAPLANDPIAAAAAAVAAKTNAMPDGPASLVAPKPAAKPKKKLPLPLVAVAVVGVVAVGALKFLGPAGRRQAAPVPAPAPVPLTPPEPPKPSPEELLEDQKKQAIELLRSWPLPDGAQVALKLETAPTDPGGLSPWFADKIRDGVFQVNFYPPKDSKKAGQAYEFEVSLDEHKVIGHNPAAVALLEGKAAAPKKAKKSRAVAKAKRKIKIKPKPAADDGGDVLGDALDLSDDPGSSAGKPASGGGDILVDGSGAASQAQPQPAAPAKKPKRPVAHMPKPDSASDPLGALVADDKTKPSKPAKPAKQESLDDLLLPGVPKERPTAPQHEQAPAADDSQPADDAAPADEPAAPKGKKKSQPADAALLEDLLKP